MASKNYPLASYLFLTYNQEAYVEDALKSALYQDYPNLEIIICDDASSDRTTQIIKKLVNEYEGPHKIHLFFHSRNKGLAGNLNFAFSEAKGRFYVLAAGDDNATPNKASALITPMIKSPHIFGVHSSVKLINLEGENIGERLRDESITKDLFFVINNGYRVVAQSHAFRKEVVEKFGPLESYVTEEGMALACREVMLGEIKYLKEHLTNYRLGSGVSSKRGEGVNQRTIQDPIKYSAFKYNSYKQVLEDIGKIQLNDHKAEVLTKEKLQKYQLLYEINKYPWAWRQLLTSLTRFYSFKHLAAFLRRNSPFGLREFYFRLKNN